MEVRTMIKNGVVIKKSNDRISFFGCSEAYGCNYLYTKPFTLGEWLYFKDGRSMDEIHSFNKWGRNPRLDKTIKRVLSMKKYIEKDLERQTMEMLVFPLHRENIPSKAASGYER